MTIPQEEIARLAAAKLSATMNPALPQLVEGVLAEPQAKRDPEMFDAATAISLASLVVSMASFAWAVYKDLKKDSQQPDQTIIARKTRLKFENTEGLSIQDRDRLIEVVVEETIHYKGQ